MLAKYSFGSWGNTPPPVVGKAPPVPSGPSGIPLTLYAGYEWIQLANPSDPQTSSFLDDGFTFNYVNAHASALSGNGTTIFNNAFNANCGSGTGCTSEIFQFAWAGAKYGITKNLDIIAANYIEWQNTFVTGVAACSQGVTLEASNSRCQGYMDAASLVLDWRFLPKWDSYIGTMYSVAYGGIANGDISPQQPRYHERCALPVLTRLKRDDARRRRSTGGAFVCTLRVAVRAGIRLSYICNTLQESAARSGKA